MLLKDKAKFAVLLAAPLVAGTISLGYAQGVDTARANIQAHRALPTFDPPGQVFDAKGCMAGKKMFIIPLSNSNPFNKAIGDAMAEAAEQVGFELRNWPVSAFDPSQWMAGIDVAIAEGYDLIDMQGGLPPELIQAKVEEANAKGIITTTTHNYDVTQTPAAFLDHSTRTNYGAAGRLIADWAIAATRGNVNALIMGPDEVTPTGPLKQSIFDRLNQLGSGNKFIYVNTPFAEWQTKISVATETAVVNDPTINWILPIYDSMSVFARQGLNAVGRDDIGIASYNGTPGSLDLLRAGGMQMNVGESLGWVGWAGVDSNMRLLCDKGKVNDINTPFLIFDDNNVDTSVGPDGRAEYNTGYGNAHIPGFRSLWQLN
ncbi:MAG: sugar ABC transporter substrate-binding protein [Alphaproteobacteria bacterium]|nr:sugar ABC transporter substrate-binding protein [Alphaproteobacteria bacterium]